MQRLADQVAIVTGGAQGLGGATARKLASEGAKILIADLDIVTAESTANDIRSAGNDAYPWHMDVSKSKDIEKTIDKAIALWGRLDILINNAFNVIDSSNTGGALEASEEDWNYGMNVMVKSIFIGAKHAVPHMRNLGSGNIINLSSVHGQLMAPGFLVYETAKAAVIGTTRQMATEFGPMGIRVNAVCPGHMVTERLQKSLWDQNPSGLRFFNEQYPLRRVGRAHEIADAIAFLCSNEASFITGHALVVDGGLSIQLQEDFGVRQAKYISEHPETQLPS